MRGKAVNSGVTDNGASCQGSLKARRLAAKVDCLGIHPIALKDLSRLRYHSRPQDRAWNRAWNL